MHLFNCISKIRAMSAVLFATAFKAALFYIFGWKNPYDLDDTLSIDDTHHSWKYH